MAAVYPRCYLTIGGAMIPCVTTRVTRNSKKEPNTFEAEFAIDVAASFGMGVDFWADYQPQDATITMSSAADGGDQRDMVTGTIDVPEIHWLENCIVVRSRDKSAALTEKKRNKKYINQKSSDIVSDIAADANLSPVVTSTPDNSGQKWDQDVVNLVLDRSDYETLNDLAEREGYRWYVDGSSLYFEPDDQSSGEFQVNYTPPTPDQIATGNVIELTTGRNMSAAKNHKVLVKSWHHKDKQIYQDTESMDGVGDDTITYEHHHNGRNQEEVKNLAKSRLNDATRHDMNVNIHMPGDLTCDVRQTLTLTGTGTIYDQGYNIDQVEWEMSWGGGFTMEIVARNQKAGRQ